jgi:hypothetical protein
LAAYVGRLTVPTWLTVTEVLSCFGTGAKRRYKEFVADGIKSGFKTPWEEVRGQVVIGSQDFVEEIAEKHLRDHSERRGEQSRLRVFVGRRPDKVLREVENYFGIKGEEIKRREQRYTEARYVASYLLRRHCLMSLREIGERVGLHYSAVGNAIRQVRDRPTASQAKSLRRLEGKINNQ